jgi:hypothetical protein
MGTEAVELYGGPLDGWFLEVMTGSPWVVVDRHTAHAIFLSGKRALVGKVPQHPQLYNISGFYSGSGCRRYLWKVNPNFSE